MKKVAVVLAVMLLVVLLGSVAVAEEMKGVIKSVDEKAGTVVLSSGGKEMTLKADKSVDLGSLKEGKKVKATVENDVLTSVKIVKPRAAVGC